MYSNSFGIKSVKLTKVAVVPFPALETVIVNFAMSSTKYSVLSLVLTTDKSTIGFGLIVLFTVLLVPFGPSIVKLFVNVSTTALTRTSTVIIAVFPAGMSVSVQVITCPFTVSVRNVAPVLLTVFMNSRPSGRLSFAVNTSV